MTDDNEVAQLKEDLCAANAKIEQKNLDIIHLKWALALAVAVILLAAFALAYS